MQVNDIRDRIVELSHQSAGDGEVQSKALGWLNAAYRELLDEVVAYLPPDLQVQQTTTANAAGMVNLSTPPYRVLRVVANGRVLQATTLAEILEMDPTGDARDDPQRYVVLGSGVRVHPMPASGTAAVTVLMVPLVVDLVEGGPESSINLPVAHHGALIWGGLVWSALFERGFGSTAEVATYTRLWQEAKARVRLGLLAHGTGTLRVQPFELV